MPYKVGDKVTYQGKRHEVTGITPEGNLVLEEVREFFGRPTGIEPPRKLPLRTHFMLGLAPPPGARTTEQQRALEESATGGGVTARDVTGLVPPLLKPFLPPVFRPSAVEPILEFGAKALGAAPELLGQAVGGIGGGALTGGPGGAIAGAGAGGAAGRLVGQQVLGRVAGLPTPPSVGMEAAKGFALGGGAEALGLAGTRLFRGGFLENVITREGKRAADFIERIFPKEVKAGKIGIPPAEMTESTFADILENIASGGFFGSRLLKFRKHTTERVSRVLKNYADALSAQIPDDQLGQMALDLLENRYQAAKLPAIALREEMIRNAQARNLQVPIQRLSETVKTLEEDALGASELGQSVLSKLRRFIATKERQVARIEPGEPIRGKPGEPFKGFMGGEITVEPTGEFASLDVETAINLRTLMGKLFESAKSRDQRQVAGKAAVLFSETDKALKSALEKEGLLQTFLRQNRIFRGAEQRFKNDLLAGIARNAEKAPERFLKSLSGADRLSVVTKLGKAIDETSEWEALQASVLRDIYEKSLASAEIPGAGTQIVVMGQKLANQAFGPSGYGQETLVRLLGKEPVSFLAEIANLLTVQQSKGLTGVGTAAVQFAQIPAAAEVAGGITGLRAIRVAAGATIIAPWLLAQMSTRPAARRWILQGLKTPRGTPEAVGIAARLLLLSAYPTGEEALQPVAVHGQARLEKPLLAPAHP